MPSLCARTSRLFSPFFVDLSSQFHTESNEPSIFGQFGHSVQLQQTAVYWIGRTSHVARINPGPPHTARPVDPDLCSRALKHSKRLSALANTKVALAFKMKVPSPLKRKKKREEGSGKSCTCREKERGHGYISSYTADSCHEKGNKYMVLSCFSSIQRRRSAESRCSINPYKGTTKTPT